MIPLDWHNVASGVALVAAVAVLARVVGGVL